MVAIAFLLLVVCVLVFCTVLHILCTGIGGTMAFGSVPSFGATFSNAQVRVCYAAFSVTRLSCVLSKDPLIVPCRVIVTEFYIMLGVCEQGAGVNPSPFAQSQGQMFSASAPATSANFGTPQSASTPFQVG